MLRYVMIHKRIRIAKYHSPAPVSAYRPGGDSVIRITGRVSIRSMLVDTLHKVVIHVDTRDTKLDTRDTARTILYLDVSVLKQRISTCINISPAVGYTQWPHVSGVALRDTL